MGAPAWAEISPPHIYIVAQIAGGIAAARVLLLACGGLIAKLGATLVDT